MPLKIAHLGIIMFDSSSDQTSLVRFRARPFHTISHQPSAIIVVNHKGSAYWRRILLSLLPRLHAVVNSVIVTLQERRMSSCVPVVELWVEHKRSKISRRQGFLLSEPLYKFGRFDFLNFRRPH